MFFKEIKLLHTEYSSAMSVAYSAGLPGYSLCNPKGMNTTNSSPPGILKNSLMEVTKGPESDAITQRQVPI